MSEPYRQTLQLLQSCICEQAVTLQILQSQLSHKVSTTQLHYGLSQKLSVQEFNKFFNRIEAVVNGMYEKSKQAENRVNSSLMDSENKMIALERNLLKSLNNKPKNRDEENSQIGFELQRMRNEIDELKLCLGEQAMLNQKKSHEIERQTVISELRNIEQYCKQNDHHIGMLMRSLKTKGKINSTDDSLLNYAKSDELNKKFDFLQQNLQKTLQKKVDGYLINMKTELEIYRNTNNKISQSAKWSCSSTGQLSFVDIKQKHTSLSTKKSTFIQQPGFYQIICGFIPLHPLEIKIFSNEYLIACHQCLEPTQNNVCRALMLYIFVDSRGCDIRIECSSLQLESEKTDGFILVQKLV